MKRERERNMRVQMTKSRRRQKASIERTVVKRLLTSFLLFVTIVGLAGYISGFFTSACENSHSATAGSLMEDASLASSTESASVTKTTYKTIQIQDGDTLWSIAAAYMTDDYDSVDSYIAELRDLNSLKSDELYTNHYLMVSCSK